MGDVDVRGEALRAAAEALAEAMQERSGPGASIGLWWSPTEGLIRGGSGRSLSGYPDAQELHLAPDGAAAEKIVDAVLAAIGWDDKLAQDPPQPSEHPSCHDLLVARLERMRSAVGQSTPLGNAYAFLIDLTLDRKGFGWRKYRSLLQPFNDRDCRMDQLAELLDAANYAEQELYEVQHNEEVSREATAEANVNLIVDRCVATVMRMPS